MLGLGDWQSANDELENIDPDLRAHLEVLKIRFHICSAAKNWELALVVAEALVRYLPDDPEPWIHRSFALHEINRTRQAQEQLLSAAEKFPVEWIVPYNLACYPANWANWKVPGGCWNAPLNLVAQAR